MDRIKVEKIGAIKEYSVNVENYFLSDLSVSAYNDDVGTICIQNVANDKKRVFLSRNAVDNLIVALIKIKNKVDWWDETNKKLYNGRL